MKKFKILLLLTILIGNDVINPKMLVEAKGIVQNINVFSGSQRSEGIYDGKHEVVDDKNNHYYYVNNSDIGNPVTNGYGDFKVYYKNGKIWEYDFAGKHYKETVHFIVLDKLFGNVHEDSVVFCIQPNKIAEWIDDTHGTNSAYNSLTSVQQKNINEYVAISISNFINSGNFDYLSAGQMKVWEEIGVKFTSYDKSLLNENNEIKRQKQIYDEVISFNNMNVELTYSQKYGIYDATITDSNGVLDEKYLSQLIGVYGGYHVEDGVGKNDLYVWNNGEDISKETVSANYNLVPKKSGYKLGVYYNAKPVYINSGQDLVGGISYDSKVSFSLKLKEAKGKAKLNKCGYINENECNAIGGATFGIFDEDDSLISEKKTDENGDIVFEDLSIGRYYAKETIAPEGYVINDTKYPFSIIKDNDVIEINNGIPIENEQIKGFVTLTKVGEKYNGDETLYPLEGVEFEIYKDVNVNDEIDEEDELIYELITDEFGKITSPELEYGRYIIKESSPIEGYINNGYIESFEITQDNKIVELYGGMDLQNDLIKGQVDLYKISEEKENKCDKYCKNNPKSNALSDVEFTIYDDKNGNGEIDKQDTKVETMLTDKNGYALSAYLRYGDYVLIETKALTGYQLSNVQYPFSIQNDQEVIHINNNDPIVNKYKTKEIEINKKDDYNKPISNVEFTIYDDINGNKKVDSEDLEIETLTTDTKGHAKSSPMKYGGYVIKETKTPKKYINDGNENSFVIDDNTFDDEIVFNIINKIKKGRIKVIKKDTDDNLLQGAKFSLYKDMNDNKKIDDSDNKISYGETNEKGELLFENVEYGKYLIQEDEAPEGYTLNDIPKYVELLNEGQEVEVQVYNMKIMDVLIHAGKSSIFILVPIVLLVISIILYKYNKIEDYI